MNSIRQTAFLSYEQYIENSYILDLHKCYDKHYSNLVSWSEIFSTLQESTRNIQIYKVPTTDKSKQLNYEKHKDTGLRAIIIGGLALSRGLTLEGLTISYLYRNTSTFDVLMQMGRWFGYRNKPKDYDDLCRVWMLEQTKSYFEDITNSIISLKSDIKSMILSKKGPIDFGIRVRNESDKLGITDRNKMRSAKKYVYTYDLYGQVLETPFVDSDDSKIRHNMLVIEKFLNEVKLTKEKKHVISKSLSKLIVLNLLKDLFIHEANRITYFEKDSILDFLLSSEFKYFDVVMFSGKGRAFIVNKMSFKSIERSFDMLDDFTIRVSDTHKRLGG
ncbi:MAG: Z1 domain-containing protein, partial [Candidatus Izemoplasmatales bacterium]|nr:Z1 domain-containing protein [Candidatus Izemoplasmatales bacterium]